MNRVDTAAILEEIAAYDQRDITADTITHWHDTIGHLPKDVASEAVSIHHKTSSFRITPEQLLDIATHITTRQTSAPHRKRRAVMLAYQVNGAINDHCPNCDAQPGHTCTAATGEEAHAPCIARLVGKTTAA
ncbi:hypothetical protein [Nocardia ignorata]|uniref:Uncharacterized protein n=1 Tax=Nocardia ignorata TaxID=145285 RepID=A0A4R6P3K4_NOCIG|nr:hypothetical protein [Nocardia ignorata]TDP29891.1 hypothetical protein DFR75_112160 [Nocardia ignorata]